MGSGVECLMLGVQVSGIRVSGFEFRVSGCHFLGAHKGKLEVSFRWKFRVGRAREKGREGERESERESESVRDSESEPASERWSDIERESESWSGVERWRGEKKRERWSGEKDGAG